VCPTRSLSVNRRPSTQARNRRERTRLLAQRDRLGNRSKFAAATIKRAAERIAALAVEIAVIDLRIGELADEADR
jgi:hypothetical protein